MAESDYALVEEHNGKKIIRYPANTKESTDASIKQGLSRELKNTKFIQTHIQ